MTQLDNDSISRHFRALSHPRRVRIFRLLAERPESGRSFGLLQRETGLCDSSLSHHLREMERCGLIRRRRKGSFMTFSLCTGAFAGALAETLRIAQPRRKPERRAA